MSLTITRQELITRATELFKKLGGNRSQDGRLVRALIGEIKNNDKENPKIVWDIYWNNSPEMKPFREYFGDDPSKQPGT